MKSAAKAALALAFLLAPAAFGAPQHRGPSSPQRVSFQPLPLSSPLSAPKVDIPVAAAPIRPVTAVEVLARLPESSHEAVAGAIAGADGVESALERLTAIGALQSGEISGDETDRVSMIRHLWDGTSASLLTDHFKFDSSLPLPSIRVDTPERVYLIHPVNHGRKPANRREVLKLIDTLASRGVPLYSEQNGPSHYAFGYGKELDDKKAALKGRPAAAGAPAHGLGDRRIRRSVVLVRTAIGVVAGVSSVTLLYMAPVAGTLILLVGAAAAFAGSGRGLLLRERRSMAKHLDTFAGLGMTDAAAHLKRQISSLYRRVVDPVEVMRLHLPPQVGQAHDELAARSRAMAEGIRADAAASGAPAVHVLVGFAHAADVAWRLAGSPRTRHEETQVS